jgi:hypothetical protein
MGGFSRPEFFLGGQGHLRQARLLSGLDHELRALLPAVLAEASHIAGLADGILLVHCDNGAAAAKLRQMAPRLANSLGRRGHSVRGLRVRVHPQPLSSRRRPVKALTLGAGARIALAELHAGLADGRLKSAIGKLLARAEGHGACGAPNDDRRHDRFPRPGPPPQAGEGDEASLHDVRSN